MIKRTILVLSAVLLTVIVGCNDRGAGARWRRSGPARSPPIAAPNVTSDRLLKSASEPQNWLMYSGTYNEPASQSDSRRSRRPMQRT